MGAARGVVPLISKLASSSYDTITVVYCSGCCVRACTEADLPGDADSSGGLPAITDWIVPPLSLAGRES